MRITTGSMQVVRRDPRTGEIKAQITCQPVATPRYDADERDRSGPESAERAPDPKFAPLNPPKITRSSRSRPTES